ncbi:four helix bundle protein [Cesiribacter sp. SM1]|uniref:four helix bundle protein n=1 Tax=Cesiribacter sp. SM1 TaxID=2861196 RepID=UPI001CD7E816|nr:four helix bundle protein [Cesiribacter sp. SM1]
MHNYKQLKVWQEAVALATDIYKLTAQFPAEERFGLQSQVRRSCVSIALNIAEGAGRATSGEFKQFIGYASGSANEVDTTLIICRNLDLLTEEEVNRVSAKLDSIQKMLYKLKSTL